MSLECVSFIIKSLHGFLYSELNKDINDFFFCFQELNFNQIANIGIERDIVTLNKLSLKLEG